MQILRSTILGVMAAAFLRGKDIEIEFATPKTPAPQRLTKGSDVKLTVNGKNPFSSCVVNAKREIVQPPDTLGDIIAKFGTILPGVAGLPVEVAKIAPPPPLAGVQQPPPLTAPPPPPPPPLNELDAIQRSQIDKAKTLHAAGCEILTELKALKTFFGTDDWQTRKDAFRTVLNARSASVKNLLNETADPVDRTGNYATTYDECLKTVGLMPDDYRRLLEGVGLQTSDTAALLDVLRRRFAVMPPAPADAALFGQLEAVQGQLEALRSAITVGRQELDKRDKYLDGLNKTSDPFTYHYVFLGENNVHRAGTVSCKDDISGDPSMEEIPVDLTWQSSPRAGLSAGVLISNMQKRVFSLAVTPDDISGGKVNSKTVQSDVSRPQIVPFSWVNIKIAESRNGKYALSISPGAGVNPNTGSNEVEFALGPALRWGKVYLFGGTHFGRQAEIGSAFPVNSHVPADGFTLPISHEWEKKFGFGISYELVPSK